MPDATPTESVKRLAAIRHAMMHLHRALLESERVRYERLNGRVGSNADFLQLALHDPWFAWLRPMSALIVAMDERMDPDAEPGVPAPESLMEQARELMRADEEGGDFPSHYHDALQRDPAVVMAHASVQRLLAPPA
jgi:hypothetical protein